MCLSASVEIKNYFCHRSKKSAEIHTIMHYWFQRANTSLEFLDKGEWLNTKTRHIHTAAKRKKYVIHTAVKQILFFI